MAKITLSQADLTEHEDVPGNIEKYILDVFQEESTQQRLKAQMEQVVRSELNQMSDLLREAIRGWVAKEKAKHEGEEQQQKALLLEEKIQRFELNNRKLTDENIKLQREVKLREIENRIIVQGLNKIKHHKQAL